MSPRDRLHLMILTPEGIILEVEDNGAGFDPQREYPGHLGLHSMRERAARLEGRLKIDSLPGDGTHLRVWIPLDQGTEIANATSVSMRPG